MVLVIVIVGMINMNERIKELATEAQIKFEAHLQHLGIDTAVITPADLKKFAELIVQECLEVVKWTPSLYSNDEYVKNIKTHFGVE